MKALHKAGRTITLMDLENLCGTGRPSSSLLDATLAALDATGGIPGSSHLVVGASSSQNVLAFGLACPHARLVWHPGQDGADLALISVALEENLPERFDTIVIGSGDAMFAIAAKVLASHGMNVVVIARDKSLARALRDSASHVLLLPGMGIAA